METFRTYLLGRSASPTEDLIKSRVMLLKKREKRTVTVVLHQRRKLYTRQDVEEAFVYLPVQNSASANELDIKPM
jgi:hypothetical protein